MGAQGGGPGEIISPGRGRVSRYDERSSANLTAVDSNDRGSAPGLHPYPQHFLNFLPEPQGQGSLRPVLGPRTMGSWERILPSV
jgi:hypothetical protein